MFEEPRLHRDQVLAPRRESYEKRPVLSATIYPDNKKKKPRVHFKTIKHNR